MNVYKHKHRSPYKQSVFFLAFYLFIFILFIASAFMKRGRGSEIDRICICSHICGGLTNLLDVSQSILTSVKSQ